MNVLSVFNGEFGWEITGYYPQIANMSTKGYKVTIHTYDSSLFMYKDLPNVKALSNGLTDRKCGLGDDKLLQVPKLDNGEEFFAVTRKNSGKFKGIIKEAREIRKDCKPKDVGKHIIVHMRKFLRGRSARNWQGSYNECLSFFKDLGYDIYFVGSPEYSHAETDYGEDIREKSMEEQLSIWKSAHFCFGPSSGAMHLSQWIGVPIFTWSDNSMRTLVERNSWTNVWNPLKVPSYHPWSNNPTISNIELCKSQQCRPEFDVLKTGIEFMLKDMKWNRDKDFKG
jgi:ADP-heptose:LPS heptosyltransferase